VTSVLDRYREESRRRYRRAAQKHQRLDIQGLRMVAVLAVFANHLWHWPRGGFVGVDVFFVISGFLITGNLLRTANNTGTVSFKTFYWNRVRRIVPAATVVLVLTYLASVLVFLPFRAHHVGVDALFAFIFMSNWWFAIQDTNYFVASDSVSPLQHYWSLSIEEQFYFVWPALIFVISLIVARQAWSHGHRMRLAGGVMGVVIAASLGWALYETATFPTWAYFNTFARMWELGVGALLATAVGLFSRIPDIVKPLLSWTGLALIVASLVLIGDGSVGFPAPWALLPVAGAALVISAGVDGEPRFQAFLRNPVSTYIGDFSYSLYLVHWPVMVILGALMDVSGSFYVMVLALSFGLAIASYHFVENPLRRADWGKLREATRDITRRRFRPERSTQYAALAAVTLVVVGLLAYMQRPDAHRQPTLPLDAADVATMGEAPVGPTMGPLTSALQNEVVTALKATDWPQFDPPVESVVNASIGVPEVDACGGIRPSAADACTWGSPSAPTRAVLIGDSVAMANLGPLREIALNSGGEFQVHSEAQYACYFINDLIAYSDQTLVDACPARKQAAADYINATKPDVVFISHSYGVKKISGTDDTMSPHQWADSLRKFVDTFRVSVKKIVFLAPPPFGVSIGDCYGKRSNTPANCITKVSKDWSAMAAAEQDLAKSIGATWVDSRPWFCNNGGLCPSFVGTTVTKRDMVHMSQAYGQKIEPVMVESLAASGVI
jgi:peptidoglycan/LPS O-acetylase OafA/YrhL